jgi:O-methyltransferase
MARRVLPIGIRQRIWQSILALGTPTPAPDADLLRKVQPYTLNSPESLKNLRRLALFINQQRIEGDFVECGTYKGGSAAILAATLSRDRHLWLYDSFEGMPPAQQVDGAYAQQWVGHCVASEQDVREALALVNTPETQYTIRKGWFQHTLQQSLPRKVAFLHCDADWYDSVSLVLDTFYPLIVEGGCVLLDDFGYWEGCREAFYDFCVRHGEKPLLERSGVSQAYWCKGRRNNR